MTAWWTQGFIPEEDAAFRKMVADYQKASGNTIDYSIVPFGPLSYKVISAITSGDVPDLVSHDAADRRSFRRMPGTTRSSRSATSSRRKRRNSSPTALLGSQYYNNVKQEARFLPGAL